MRYLHIEDIEFLAVGAAVLGAGGGGDPYLGKLMAIQAIKDKGPVQLLDVSELEDDDWVIPTAMMGAPSVLLEKLPNGREPENAFTITQEVLGHKARATMPIEAGGINSTIPSMWPPGWVFPWWTATVWGALSPKYPWFLFPLAVFRLHPWSVLMKRATRRFCAQ